MGETNWWEDPVVGNPTPTDGADDPPPEDPPEAAPKDAAHTVAPGLLPPPVPAGPPPAVDAGPPPSPVVPATSGGAPPAPQVSSSGGSTGVLRIVVGVLVVVVLVGAFIVLASDDAGSPASTDLEELAAGFDRIGDELGVAELTGEERPSPGDLGLDDRFTEPRTWRTADGTLVVAYARSGDDDDRVRIEQSGAIAGDQVAAAGDGASVVADELIETSPPIRLTEVETPGTPSIRSATGYAATGAVVVVGAIDDADGRVDLPGLVAGVIEAIDAT
ncbi:MAG: hypothetical protein RIB98_11515 [Acidimicrobiales bacterium]